MTKEQFFMELEECLQGEVSAHELADSLSYYRQYFDEQAAKGKGEQEVISELGSARLIARSIIDAHGLEENGGDSYRSDNAGSYSGSDSYYSYDGEEEVKEEKDGLLDKVGKKVVSIGVMVIVFLIVFLLVRTLLPLAVLFLAIWLILQLFQK